MKNKFIATCFMAGTLLAPVMSHADADADRNHPGTYVRDSVITTKIKAKLAAEHFASITQINVDTDKDGAVWLSGTAASQADADKATSIVHATEGVTSVKSDITIKPAR